MILSADFLGRPCSGLKSTVFAMQGGLQPRQRARRFDASKDSGSSSAIASVGGEAQRLQLVFLEFAMLRYLPGMSSRFAAAVFLPGQVELIEVQATMTVLTTSLDRRSEMFAANAAAMRALVEDLREKVAAVREGGAAAGRSPLTSAGGSGRSSSGLPRFLRWVFCWMRSIKKPLSVHLQPKSWGSFDNRA
jgi:hypothetical protein